VLALGIRMAFEKGDMKLALELVKRLSKAAPGVDPADLLKETE